MKKGQVTVYIILGVIFLAVLGFFAITRAIQARDSMGSDQDNTLEQPTQAVTVEDYFQTCAQKVSDHAVILLGLQGGYTDLSTKTTYYGEGLLIPLWYMRNADGATTDIPSEARMELELERYANRHIKEVCVAETQETFSSLGYEITAEKVTSEVDIADEGVYFAINAPLTLVKEDSTQKLTEWNTFVRARLLSVHSIGKGIIDEVELDPLYIPLSHVLEQAYDNRLHIRPVRYYEDSVVLYIIRDDIVTIDEVPFYFLFTTKVR